MEKNVFSQNTVEQAVNAIKEHEVVIKAMKEKASAMPLADVAQELLMDRLGISQIEAEEIVVDLKAGIENFDSQYKATVEQERISVVEQLAEKTKDLSDEERVDYYGNILTALQLLGKDDITEDMVTAKQKENTNKTAEELEAEIESLLNGEISLDALADAVQDNVNEEALNEIAKIIEMKKDDYRFLVALWLYIDQREGKIQFTDSDVKIPAVTLGVLAGASIEALIATNDLNEGKIDLKRWQVIMKWILGAAILVGMLVLSATLFAFAGMSVILLFMSLFGNSLLALMAATAWVIYLGNWLGEATADCSVKALEYLFDIYDKYIVIVTDKVAKWIAVLKKWVAKTIQKAKQGLGSDNNSVEPNENVVTTQTNEGTTEETFMQPSFA